MSDVSHDPASVSRMPGVMKDAFDRARQRGRGNARDPTRALDEATERLSRAGRDAIGAVEDLVRARPMATACVALGLGYLFGAALGNANRRRGR